MATIGGDLQTLQALKRKLDEASSDTADLKAKVDSGVSDAVWTGVNADTFRESWTSFKVTLDKIAQALTEASADVKTQHNNLAAAMGAGERI